MAGGRSPSRSVTSAPAACAHCTSTATATRVSVSKTVAVPVATLSHAVVTTAERDRWLEPGALRLRTAQPNRSARFDVIANDTRLSVYFLAKDDAKSSVQFQHERLPGANDVEVWRAYWKAALERLAAILSVG